MRYDYKQQHYLVAFLLNVNKLSLYPIGRGLIINIYESSVLRTLHQHKLRLHYYDFSVPDTYTQLIEMVDKYELDEQNVVIERMRKCHHASLAEENKIHLIVSYLLFVQL